jgi:drug/metabolite transporter (DMT)-like permease
MSSSVQSPALSKTPGVLSWIALLTVWFVWGSTYLGIRVAVQAIPPFLMSGSRYTVAGALLFAIVWFAQGRPRVKISAGELRSIIVAAVSLLVIGNGLLCFSEVRLESGTATLLVATVPMWMILIDALLERALRILPLIAIVLGTLGIAVLVGKPSAGHSSFTAIALVLAGSLSWAIGSVYARRHSTQHLNPLLPALEMLIAGLLMLCIGASLGEPAHLHVKALPLSSIFGWTWLVVAGAMIAYSAFGYAVRTLPTTIVATYAYVNPIVAVVLGALLLKEPLTWNVIAGGCAIVASVAVIVLDNRNKPAGARSELRSEIGDAA